MKRYDFGEGYSAVVETTPSGKIIVKIDTLAGKFETEHRSEQDAMREILSYFELHRLR